MRMPNVWLPAVAGGLILSTPAMALGEDARTPEAVAAAKALMRDVGEAYAKAPAMTDEMTMSFKMEGAAEQSFTSPMRFEGKNAEVKGLVDMFDLYAIDGTLFVITEMSDDGAVRAEIGDDPAAALAKALGEDLAVVSPTPLLFRLGASADDVRSSLGMGLVREPQIVGHHMVKTDDGGSLHEVLIEGDNDGQMRLQIDPKTKFIVKSFITGLPEDYPGTDPIVATTVHRPALVAGHASPIAFELGKREVYDDVDAMMAASMRGAGGRNFNPKIDVGAEAPTFALVDQDGQTHRLEDYRGQVVVLDWWGIW